MHENRETSERQRVRRAARMARVGAGRRVAVPLVGGVASQGTPSECGRSFGPVTPGFSRTMASTGTT